MTKQEFFTALRSELASLPASEVDDIIRDQEEFLHDAVRSGRAETDALGSLGTPKSFAAGLLAESRLQKASEATGLGGRIGNTWAAMLAMMAVLAPLNIFIMIWPFAFAVGMLFTGWALSISFSLAAIGVFLVFLLELLFIPAGIWTHLSMMFLTLGSVGFTAFCILVSFMLTKGFVELTIRYLKWNLAMIAAKA